MIDLGLNELFVISAHNDRIGEKVFHAEIGDRMKKNWNCMLSVIGKKIAIFLTQAIDKNIRSYQYLDDSDWYQIVELFMCTKLKQFLWVLGTGNLKSELVESYNPVITEMSVCSVDRVYSKERCVAIIEVKISKRYTHLESWSCSCQGCKFLRWKKGDSFQ